MGSAGCGTGEGKIRCSSSSWEDAKIILEGQALGVPASLKLMILRYC
jgi:hypothetical protein